MESTDSSTGSQQPQLPPGFRFHPTDEELVVHYLKKKAAAAPLPVSIIAEVDLYKFDPWELPAKAIFGEQEWYFFSPRDRKYPNGARPNRAATSGYWKATGTDKPVLTAGGTHKVGVKKALVFYGGKPPKGVKTNWIMHEYRLVDNSKPSSKPPGCDFASKKGGSLRLDDWVLCRIYKKSNANRPMEQLQHNDHIHEMNINMNIGGNSINHQNLSSPSMDHHHGVYEGMMNVNEAMNGQLESKSMPTQLHLVPHNLLPGKRGLPGNLFWNDEGNASSPSTKRFLAENYDARNEDQSTNSMASTIFSQLPGTPSLHQQAMLGSLGDGVFGQQQQYGVNNWYA